MPSTSTPSLPIPFHRLYSTRLAGAAASPIMADISSSELTWMNPTPFPVSPTKSSSSSSSSWSHRQDFQRRRRRWGDIIDFAEFRRRVGKKCSVNDSRAFFEFQERRGKPGDPLYVLLCCWLAAVGAGLLKSEEILEGVGRLRISDDIEFEEENFIAMMNDSRERRAKLRAPVPTIPMEIRAEKALEAIHVCCFGRDLIEEEDKELLSVILNAVFPAVGMPVIERIVKEKAKRVAEGTDEIKIPEPKPLPKEAVQLQMKDLQFLREGNTE
ncbi:Photosystem I assembly factor PSA3, chloroplastic [Sesamum angolense]|uniref:Photosystem I assembly factor PSA3, chloroplastic n=1 Tax=Sesamum angolense TaxID=2727404 RepID=A0AAE2BGW9_9LAMI|nr:Photosystem I assembly factor PSA3, chloroplastic [Sesamum angolense]